MNALANIDVGGARLPAAYEAAKIALANCASLDECQQWADKAEALASYAKQADDDTLRKTADRIQARAIRRCGELLKLFKNERARTDLDKGALTQRKAAEEAGLSLHQQRTAVRVAAVPANEFERIVESDEPATVTRLAEMGRKPLVDLKGRDPAEFNRSLHFIAEIREYGDTIRRANLDLILPSLLPSEAATVRSAIAEIDAIHDRIMTRI